MLRDQSPDQPATGTGTDSRSVHVMSEAEEQPFLPAAATRRRGRQRRRNASQQNDPVPANNSHYYYEPKRCSLQKLLSIVTKDAVKELATKVEQKLVSLLAPDDCSSIQEIVIYGIGSFMTCHMARSQLALICALRKRIAPQIRAFVFDPVLKQEDYRLLQERLDIDPILQNEACKRSIQSCSGKVLFFMPHLDKELYSNLLSANWRKGELDRLLILGNSFTNMSESQPTRIVLSECPYVVHAIRLGLLREQGLDFIDDFDDCLNDLSLHAFSCDQVSQEEMSAADRRA